MDGQPEPDLADTVGPALAVILGTLPPPERIAYVLHDVFGIPYELIATVLGRSAASTRTLAAHARERVRGTPG